ncbi:hypothetical protein [Sphingomonas solaris]|nr:hypothetical protein [Sphingomonas solaris]
MARERLDPIDDWFDDAMVEVPCQDLLDLLERCLKRLAEETPTLH